MIIKTLTELKRAVEYEASVRGQIGTGNTFRHPVDDIEAEVNSAYAEMREMLVTRDFDYFIEETAQALWPTSRADTDENYSLIDWPANALLIKRVDVVKNQNWESLEEIDWTQLRLAISPSANTTNQRPQFFSAKSFGTITGSTEVAGKIALAPFATGGKYKISYMPRWIDITNDTDEFIFPSETCFRWCVWNTVARICVRDESEMSTTRYNKSVTERSICEDRIGKFVPRTIGTGGGQMRRNPNYHGYSTRGR